MISAIGSSSSYDNWWQLQQSGSTSSTNDLFSKIDTNGDSSVSTSELSTFLSEMEAQFTNSVMNSQFGTTGTTSTTEDLFSKIDTNGDGSISASELGTYQTEMKKNMQAMGPPPPDSSTQASSTDDLFSKIDTNGDGSISASELSTFQSNMEAQNTANSTTTSTGSDGSQVSSIASMFSSALEAYMQLSSNGFSQNIQGLLGSALYV